jgi:hypothetical protein
MVDDGQRHRAQSNRAPGAPSRRHRRSRMVAQNRSIS